jgi:hypothetical protein
MFNVKSYTLPEYADAGIDAHVPPDKRHHNVGGYEVLLTPVPKSVTVALTGIETVFPHAAL